MTFSLWCLLAAAWLPLVWALASKLGLSGYDNANPPQTMAGVSGWRQRAKWAQSNAWEAYAPFAAAVLTAHFLEASQSTSDGLAALFMIARILHGVFYIVNWATARSLAWAAGMAAVIGLFVAAA